MDAYALSGADMQRYVSKKRSEKVSPSTVNRELALLSVAVNHAQVGRISRSQSGTRSQTAGAGKMAGLADRG